MELPWRLRQQGPAGGAGITCCARLLRAPRATRPQPRRQGVGPERARAPFSTATPTLPGSPRRARLWPASVPPAFRPPSRRADCRPAHRDLGPYFSSPTPSKELPRRTLGYLAGIPGRRRSAGPAHLRELPAGKDRPRPLLTGSRPSRPLHLAAEQHIPGPQFPLQAGGSGQRTTGPGMYPAERTSRTCVMGSGMNRPRSAATGVQGTADPPAGRDGHIPGPPLLSPTQPGGRAEH